MSLLVNIRGAITIENNTVDDILRNTTILLNSIIKHNNLNTRKIISVFFSCTRDITAAYPARAARDMGLSDVSLMCFQEMYVENSLEKCIRVSVFYDDNNISQDKVSNIYLNEARKLRPDKAIKG